MTNVIINFSESKAHFLYYSQIKFQKLKKHKYENIPIEMYPCIIISHTQCPNVYMKRQTHANTINSHNLIYDHQITRKDNFFSIS